MLTARVDPLPCQVLHDCDTLGKSTSTITLNVACVLSAVGPGVCGDEFCSCAGPDHLLVLDVSPCNEASVLEPASSVIVRPFGTAKVVGASVCMLSRLREEECELRRQTHQHSCTLLHHNGVFVCPSVP